MPVGLAALLAEGIGAMDTHWGALPKETALSFSEKLPALSLAWSSPFSQPPLHNTAGHYSRQVAMSSLTTRQASACLSLPVEQWALFSGKYWGEIVSKVATHDAMPLKVPQKGNLLHEC